jgi:DNA-binding transcriptional LysR family regulator
VSGPVRQLPLRVPIGDGEALDSWLLRLAYRNQIPLRWLLEVLGLAERVRVWHNYALVAGIPAEVLRRIETQTGLAPHALDAAVLDHYKPLGWKPTAGSWYCPACLEESSGRWPLRWQLPQIFACTHHRCLLVSSCPACGRAPHGGISEKSGLLPPHRCALRPRPQEDICEADLLTHPVQTLAADDPRLAAQEWINQRLEATDDAATTQLRDLGTLAHWFRQRLRPDDVTHLDDATVKAVTEYIDPKHRNRLRRQPPSAPLVTAAVATLAVELLTADGQTRYHRFVPLFRDANSSSNRQTAPGGPPPGPMMLSHKRMTQLSIPLQHKLLAACNPHLPLGERLRYRTCTTTPRLPEPGSTTATDRARHIPQYLWHDWIIRLQPLTGLHTETVATDLPAVLLIPGNPVRNEHATEEIHPWTNHTSQTLRRLFEAQPDAPAVLCALADHLDVHGSPIDYRRRRATFTDIELTQAQWHDLCHEANTNPGRASRHQHARRYLFQLLTGANLSSPEHLLSFRTPNEKSHYCGGFQWTLTSSLREALQHHAARTLKAAGIDEPVTWSPPADCVAGLTLPGREPDDIDLAAVRQLLLIDELPPQTAARQMGVTVEQIRHALQRLHRPPSPEPVRRRRTQASDLLTLEYFEREHLRAGKDLATVAAETGYSLKLVTRLARSHGIRRAPRPRGLRIDPTWLREQAETLQRTNGDIAAELGVSDETIRRYRNELGIGNRPTGDSRHRKLPHLPDDIRRAVEGKRHGWQRLRRFQQMMAYHSMNVAATALGSHASNLALQLQLLEADIGAPLLQRSGHRHQPMTLTDHGRRLLEQLHQPEVRQLLEHHTGPTLGHASGR